MTAPGGPARTPIRRLSRDVVEKIAAGEVVERPASVVKELVENAIDAGSTSVTVRLAEGGLGRIEVADDGTGIPAEELELAVERHATSKLPPTGPVERIGSLGFRGEALAAIAAVAHLRLVSRPPGAEVGEGIEVAAGATRGRFAAPRAPGTTVEVRDLFYNTPARRKFLGSAVREQLEVLRTAERIYLARPTVALRLETEAGEVANYPATDDLAEAAARALGSEFPDRSFPLRCACPGGEIVGVLGRPELASAISTRLFLAVNGRPIVARALAQAVRSGFGDAIPRSRFPVGVLHLTIDADRLDVNVHPTKREVRLAAERDVAEALRRGVGAALRSAGRPVPLPEPSRSPAPALGGSRPSQPPPVPSAPAPGVARAAGGPEPLARVGTQRTLPVADASPLGTGYTLPSGSSQLELLGPVQALYWAAASDRGLVLIDQHAASERLLYATLRRGGVIARQTLVEPIVLALTAAERVTLEAHAEEVRAAGFEVEPFGPGTLRVVGVPSYRGRTVRADAVRELLGELGDGGRPTVPDGLEERRAASIACHAAIRAGDVVERTTIAEILRALDRLPERPSSCPHGRPIMILLSRARLDRWFLRSGA